MMRAAVSTVGFTDPDPSWTNYTGTATVERESVELALELIPVKRADIALVADDERDVRPRPRSEWVSRAANVFLAATALVVLSPLLLVIAIAIRLTSRGPALYTQTRVGVDRRYHRASTYDRRGFDHGGQLFEIYKFRSMRVDAESDGREVWASPSDPRVTTIGRFLRRTRIDELPQLYNVLRGDMNLVGPRPERPTIFARLRQDIPEYAMRQRVRPGITGWAQINLAYDACLDDVRNKVKYDLEYLRRQSLAEDLRIMSMTLPVMLFRRGSC
jgi:lipopolysaccharide/colanic/teichoic acid biosynthesis glycosyltransferase